MRKRILLFGFYGYDNTGDELLLAGMVESLRRQDPDVAITVFSADPRTTEKQLDVRAVFAGRRHEGLGCVWRAIRNSDLFILGGGGLLQDRERRILPFWFSRVGMAKALGKKVMFYGIGVGPIATELGKSQVRYFANRADLITVRDPESAEILQRCGVARPPVMITADPALAMERLAVERTSVGRIGICLRDWPNWHEQVPALAMALDRVIEVSGRELEMLPLQGAADREAARVVCRMMKQGHRVILREDTLTPLAVAERLGEMELVVSMRLHGLILACLQKVPCTGISYDPKVKQFMATAGLNDWVLDLSQVTGEALAEQIIQAWGVRTGTRAHLRQVIPSLQNKAEENARLAAALLHSKRRW